MTFLKTTVRTELLGSNSVDFVDASNSSIHPQAVRGHIDSLVARASKMERLTTSTREGTDRAQPAVDGGTSQDAVRHSKQPGHLFMQVTGLLCKV
jgi:hypothetical protein